MWHAYEDFIGKSIDFFEFLNTEIPVYRGKNSENFTEDDTFISFSFDENIAKKFGDTVIQTLIKPIETLGNLSRSGEYEVMVPRESIAAYDNIPNGVKIDYSNPNDENAQQILAVTNARKEEAEAHRENEAAIIRENAARRDGQAIEAEVKRQIEERDELWTGIEDLKDADKVDVSFYITDETFDKSTVLQNLQQILVSYRQFSQDPNAQIILRNIFDILGLDGETLISSMSQQGQMAQGQGQGVPQGELQGQQEGAMTEDGLLASQNQRVANQEQSL